jgi:hypothetical protein
MHRWEYFIRVNPYHYSKKSRISAKIFQAAFSSSFPSFAFVQNPFGCGFAALGPSVVKRLPLRFSAMRESPGQGDFGCGWPRWEIRGCFSSFGEVSEYARLCAQGKRRPKSSPKEFF